MWWGKAPAAARAQRTVQPARLVARVGDLENHRIGDLEVSQLLEARGREDDLVRVFKGLVIALALGRKERHGVAASGISLSHSCTVSRSDLYQVLGI